MLENEQAQRSAVDRVGRGGLLPQVFVDRAGHCAFTPAETITAVKVLPDGLATGSWNVPSQDAMNSQAAAVGPRYDIYSVSGQVQPAVPAFLQYQPDQYLRPFDLSWPGLGVGPRADPGPGAGADEHAFLVGGDLSEGRVPRTVSLQPPDQGQRQPHPVQRDAVLDDHPRLDLRCGVLMPGSGPGCHRHLPARLTLLP
jgi:hypothetical protein